MAGILDLLTGNDQAASPWGMLYQDPDASNVMSTSLKRIMQAAGLSSPFGDPSNPSVAAPPVDANQPSPLDTAQYPAGPVGAPGGGFGAGGTPFGFAGPGGAPAATPAPAAAPGPSAAPSLSFADRFAPALEQPMRQVAQQPVAAPAVAPAVANANAAAPADDENDPIAVGKYQMPRIGSGFPDEEAAPVPAKVANANASISSSPAPFSLGGVMSGVGDRLDKAGRGFLGNMALGPIGALAGGLGSLVTGKSTDPTSIANEKMNLTVQSLLKKGASVDEVQAASQNPELMKALIGQYFGKEKWKVQQTGEMLGQKTFKLFNEQDGTFKDIPAGAGGGGSAPGGIGMLAPGVKEYNPNLSGDAYMAQFGPEVQAAAKAYINGDVMPTGNARKDTIATLAKTVAQKWGQDTGQEVSDRTYGAKRTMQNDLEKSTPGSIGGIIDNGKSAFTHLAIYSGKLADVGDYNGPDVPGGALLADVGNFVGNKLLPTAATRDKISGANSAAIKYGQESTKFYAGTGGGEGERMNALHNNDAASTTGAQQAGFLQTEKELMLGRLKQKEDHIRSTLGQGYLDKHPVTTPDLQKDIATIDANIARLRGQAPAGAAAAPGAAPVGGTVNVGGKPIQWSVK